MFSYINQEFIPCDMCKYWNEECNGDHCGHCGRYDYDKFKLDYVSQIAKDFNCSRSLAKDMYYAMIVKYRTCKKFRGCNK